ncbi:MAG TPA: hypothetical protein VF074_13290, partial [Pyrinomonadaceae bacterium]
MVKPRFIGFFVLALLVFDLRVLPQVRNTSSPALPVITFEDVTKKSGITWVHSNAESAARHLPEAVGPGCAFVDYDNDRWMDIFFLNSGSSDFFTPT